MHPVPSLTHAHGRTNLHPKLRAFVTLAGTLNPLRAQAILVTSEARPASQAFKRKSRVVPLSIPFPAPLRFCGRYDCFEGVVSADMSRRSALVQEDSTLQVLCGLAWEVMVSRCGSNAKLQKQLRAPSSDGPR